MITAEEIEKRIKDALPDASITIQDLTGGQDHYKVDIVSTTFAGMSPIARHRHVYGLFGDVMGGALHALSLSTKTPDE